MAEPNDPYAAALADLEAKRAEIDSTIATLKRLRGTPVGEAITADSSKPTSKEPVPVAAQEKTANTGIVLPKRVLMPESPYFGLNLPQAVAKALEIAKGPASVREVWAMLEADGYPSISESPVNGVHWALRRRMEKAGDIILIGRGKWALRSRYTEDELASIQSGLGGMAGRDREHHILKTKEAIANSKAIGVRWGRKAMMTPELITTVERMLLAQEKVADVAAQLKISKATIYGYFTIARRDGRQTVERRNQPPSTPLRLVK
jgi:hypothetical protein